MRRHAFEHDGLTLSFLDDGGDRPPVIALHAHWMEALTYEPLAQALAAEWRVIALDQRGHGRSGHAATYLRTDYLRDLEAFFAHLGLERAVLLGNSLGGVNAYQFAAQHPERVSAMIVEDIGAVISADTSFALDWAGTFKTRKDLETRIGPRMAPYLAESFRQTPEGWRLAFEPTDMVASQESLDADHWEDWLASDCPALLIHGRESRVTMQAHLEQMAARRPHTQLRIIPGGHVVHVDNPEAFTTSVRGFLQGL